MDNNNVVALSQPEDINDPLTELLRQGAKELISKAVEAELIELLEQFNDVKIEGKQAVVRKVVSHLSLRAAKRRIHFSAYAARA